MAEPFRGVVNVDIRAEIPESQAVNIRNRSYVVGAQGDISADGAQGVLFAHGSRFGGHALYVKDNRLHYAYNSPASSSRRSMPPRSCRCTATAASRTSTWNGRPRR